MTQAEFGNQMGLSQKVIKQIVRGEASISAEMASKLERTLGVPASFWINLEKNYRKSMDRIPSLAGEGRVRRIEKKD